jgi:formyltetrahydrofolate hydrolase
MRSNEHKPDFMVLARYMQILVERLRESLSAAHH